MDPNDGKMGRLPFGDITNISVLGAQNLHGNELKRQRERLCASGLSQEQRDEGNKRRREAYAKKKNKKQTGATSNATHQSKQGHVADVLMMILAGDVWRWPRREQHPLHEDLFLIHYTISHHNLAVGCAPEFCGN